MILQVHLFDASEHPWFSLQTAHLMTGAASRRFGLETDLDESWERLCLVTHTHTKMVSQKTIRCENHQLCRVFHYLRATSFVVRGNLPILEQPPICMLCKRWDSNGLLPPHPSPFPFVVDCPWQVAREVYLRLRRLESKRLGRCSSKQGETENTSLTSFFRVIQTWGF